MNKKYYYYSIFIIIPIYVFSGSFIDYINHRDDIVNTLEMPINNYENKVSDYQKYKLDANKFDKPVIKDSLKVLWLLNIEYTNYSQTKKNLFNLGLEKIYKNYKDKKELLVGPFEDKEIAEYMKKKLERSLSANISLVKVSN
tara:strand:+ start:658 stop:1083 length:426 start_codon:yes stop_codon:yes gene_type:complete